MNNPTPPLTPSQVFLLAHDYIEDHGWTQGKPEEPGGAVCLWQAVIICKPKDNAKLYYRQILRETTEIQSMPKGFQEPEIWNDADSRTSREVLDLLWRLGHEGIPSP